MTTVPLLPFLRRSLPTTLLAGVVVSGLIVMARGPGLFFVDGPIFLDASQRLLAGQPLYIEGFYGPPWMAVLYTPFTLLPLGLKYTLLYYLGLVLVGVSAWVLLASTKWRWQRRLLFTGLCLIFPPSAWAVSIGQSTIIMLLTGAIAILLLPRHSFWAGVILASWSIKPQIAVLPLAFMALYTLARGDTRYLNGLLSATAVLLWTTVWLWYDLFGQWVVALSAYQRLQDPLYVWHGGGGTAIVILSWLIGAALAAWGFTQKRPEMAFTTFMMAGIYLMPVSHYYDLALLLIPVALGLKHSVNAWPIAVSFIAPAMVNLSGLPFFTLAPIAPLLLLLLTRRLDGAAAGEVDHSADGSDVRVYQ